MRPLLFILLILIPSVLQAKWDWQKALPRELDNSNSKYFIGVGTEEHPLPVPASDIEKALKAGKEIRLKYAFIDQALEYTGTVEKAVYFLDTFFKDAVSFEGTHFKDEVHFERANLNAETSFENTKFDAEAFFEATQFAAKTSFSGTAFAANASFEKAIFDSEASFWHARFVSGLTLRKRSLALKRPSGTPNFMPKFTF